MSKGWLRFRDLKARNIVKSYTQLRRMRKLYGFPSGRMITPQIRGWTEEEIDAYYASCPVEGPPLKGAAKVKHERRRKAAENNTAA
jgi:predicted DNA-binding transcriptional regulator AlpA